MAFSASFYGYVIKLEHALKRFAYYISTKNSWRALFTNSE